MTIDDLAIAPAEPSDLYSIAQLHIRSWRWCHAEMVPDEFLNQLDPTAWILRYTELQQQNKMAILAAKLAGEPVGMAIFGRDPASPQRDKIDSLYVAPDKLRRRIGHRLLGDVLGRLDQDLVALECATENTTGRGFWETHGFHLNGETAAFTVPEAGVDVPTVWYVLERKPSLRVLQYN